MREPSRPQQFAVRTLQYLRRSRVHIGLSRAAATATVRELDSTNPDSWEFSAFSAAGEDGIIDYLTRRMHDPEFVFLEIGAGDCVQNNTAYLAIARKWQGVMIDADPAAIRRGRAALDWYNPLVDVRELQVTEKNVDQVLGSIHTLRPDVFSLDIDGFDYHVARALFTRGLRPRLCVVEYNSAYGPSKRCTVNPELLRTTQERLYYGVSVAGWRSFFADHGYRFIGVERTGVNAFFLHPDSFDRDFLDAIRGRDFAENLAQRRERGDTWEQQLHALDGLELIEIP